MQLAQAVPSAGKSTAYDFRKGLIQVGYGLTAEELLNLPLFAYLAMNGLIGGLAQVPHIGLITATFYCSGTTLAFLRNRAHVPWHLLTCRFAFLFLAVTIASCTWSTQPLSVTYQPAAVSFCTFLYYCYLADRYTINDFVRMMTWVFAVLLAVSLVTVLLAPGIGIDNGMGNPEDRGAWQGIFVQKNQLGAACGLSVALALGLRPTNAIDRFWRRLLFSLGLVCAAGTQSRETWIAVIVVVSLSFGFRILRATQPSSRLPLVLVGGGGITIIAGLIYANLDSLLALIGRTRRISGRSDIWDGVLLLIRERPWLGYGMFGVWHTPYAWPVVARAQWEVTSSHNNYLELLLTSGIIGMAAYAPLILSAIFYSMRALLSYDLNQVAVLIYIMAVILVLSMASPLVLYTPAVGMILVLYSVTYLEQVERSGFMRLDR